MTDKSYNKNNNFLPNLHPALILTPPKKRLESISVFSSGTNLYFSK